VLRHQLVVLRRQVARPRFAPRTGWCWPRWRGCCRGSVGQSFLVNAPPVTEYETSRETSRPDHVTPVLEPQRLTRRCSCTHRGSSRSARTTPNDPATADRVGRPDDAGPRPHDEQRATPRSWPRRFARATPATQRPGPQPGTASESSRHDRAPPRREPSSRNVRQVLARHRCGANGAPPPRSRHRHGSWTTSASTRARRL